MGKSKIYKKEIKGKYDTEIAFLEGPITRIFSVKNNDVKKIAWIHNDISQVFGNNIKAKVKKMIDKKIYSKYQELIFVSKDNLDKFNKMYPSINVEKKVIHNYIDKEEVLRKAKEKQKVEFDRNEFNLVTVTRLVEQKGIDRLIDIHKKLVENGIKHNIYVIGDGPEKEKLKNRIKEKQIENTFFLLGKQTNPYPYIKNADYFCLLSKFEGYGMVIEEAKILDKNIVITNTAAREAVENYPNKFILENTEEDIYNGLAKIISTKNIEKNKLENRNQGYDNSNILYEVKEILGDRCEE